ncbi:hypothetical protein NITGR_160044 [Nitrospina gracilis 3/211]|uniref:PEGA domain-containing protein n=1 Tax=Nitrospina gracilis (strain 3/211) TaxID=1266370 RepID=M1YVU3_NITG3|nr:MULTISPECIES: hypothetical protein [Nitrospina]MCF8722783.1 hypothetical protein [Nitrospina sp. Nb-3]CCQ89734.1 hypothetical protein NITGR_160044 [Nitrospina gracilis 3/211]
METPRDADRRGQGTVLILRKARMSFFRRIWIHVNGEKHSKIAEDECIRIPLSVGQHTFRVSQDWCRSKPISMDVSAGEKTYLMCYSAIGKYGALSSIIFIIILPHKLFSLVEVSKEDFEAEKKDKYPAWKKTSLLIFCVLALGVFIFYLL